MNSEDFFGIDLSKYTKHGKFKLHSGTESDVFYDIKSMICDKLNLYAIISHIESISESFNCKTYIGIESLGSTFATMLSAINSNSRLAIITKENELVGQVIEPYILIDDVITTGKSIQDAIDLIGKYPISIFCVIDRRTIKSSIYNTEVISMFKI